MEKTKILMALSDAMDKNASLVYAHGSKEALLQNGSEFDLIQKKGTTQQHLRQALLKAGDILEENDTTGVITAVVPTGRLNASRALVVAQIVGDNVEIAAFFQEGLIKQHGAKQAIDAVKKHLQ